MRPAISSAMRASHEAAGLASRMHTRSLASTPHAARNSSRGSGSIGSGIASSRATARVPKAGETPSNRADSWARSPKVNSDPSLGRRPKARRSADPASTIAPSGGKQLLPTFTPNDAARRASAAVPMMPAGRPARRAAIERSRGGAHALTSISAAMRGRTEAALALLEIAVRCGIISLPSWKRPCRSSSVRGRRRAW